MARNLSIRTDSPEVLPDKRPHVCYEGFVYIGHMVEAPDLGEVEVIERVPCHRCHATENL